MLMVVKWQQSIVMSGSGLSTWYLDIWAITKDGLHGNQCRCYGIDAQIENHISLASALRETSDLSANRVTNIIISNGDEFLFFLAISNLDCLYTLKFILKEMARFVWTYRLACACSRTRYSTMFYGYYIEKFLSLQVTAKERDSIVRNIANKYAKIATRGSLLNILLHYPTSIMKWWTATLMATYIAIETDWDE